MRLLIAVAWMCVSCAGLPALGQTRLEPIEKVEIGNSAELRVNGKPFFPLMLWLQPPRNFARQSELGFNAVAGYAEKPGQMDAYYAEVRKAGMYFVASLPREIGDDARQIAGGDALLGWIQGDEPDMPRDVSDADVLPAKHMRVNSRTPYYRLVDGNTNSWTALEPVAGGEFSIRLKAPVTVQSLAVWQTISGGLSVAKDVVFLGDGKELLKGTLENKKGRQKFDLPQPATFRELTVKITSEYTGTSGYGSIGEIEGFDAEGKNVLIAPPRVEPRTSAEELAKRYEAARQLDPKRPVLMTFTSNFMGKSKFDAETRARIYPAYARFADVVGFDTYPIFGFGMPGRLHEVADGVSQLCGIAGPGKPVYAWIETNKGSQWMTLEKQLDVLPEHTRCEVWMAIIRGAHGIAYFTHRWQPDYKQFALTADMETEVRRLNGQIARLAPAILAEPAKVKVEMRLEGDRACHATATMHDGAVYVFAQNIDLGPGAEKLRQFEPIAPRPGQATLTVPGLAAGAQIEVVDESRSIAAEAGRFTDDFPPLREHVYRIPAGAIRP